MKQKRRSTGELMAHAKTILLLQKQFGSFEKWLEHTTAVKIKLTRKETL